MKYKQVFNLIKKVVGNTLSNQDLKKNHIVKYGNKFLIFDRFFLKQENDDFIIRDQRNDKDIYFNLSKSAIAWCILYNNQYYDFANDILKLDHKLFYNQFEIDFLSNRFKLFDLTNDEKEIIHHKLEEKIFRQNNCRKKLMEYVEVARFIKMQSIHKIH